MSSAPSDPVAHLRTLSTQELIQVGEDSLREHLVAQAIVAHQKYQPFSADQLTRFLADPDCLRHPTRLVFEYGEMAPHQFAQPDLDHRNTAQDGRVLYLRPILQRRPDLTLLAVAYMVPVINYGEVISDAHCLNYGATLLGLTEAEFYEKICTLADFAGSETKLVESPGGADQNSQASCSR